MFGRLLLLLTLTGWMAAFADDLVENGIQPTGQPHTLVLKEDLRLTPDTDENFVWVGRYISFDVDEDGFMYVADPRRNAIVKISPAGEYAGTIGSGGSGPGEFLSLRGFGILANGEAISFENLNLINQFNFYDADLNFVKEARAKERYALTDVSFSPDGRFILGQYSSFKKGVEFIGQGMFEVPSLKPVKLFNKVEANNQFDYSKLDQPGFWREFIPSRLKFDASGDVGYAAFDTEGNVFSAVGHTYEITKWSPQMKKRLTITREFKAIPQTEADIQAQAELTRELLLTQMPHLAQLFTDNLLEQSIERAEYLPRKHPIYGLSVMEDGTLLVVHSYSQATLECIGDLFSPEGRYLGSFSHPNGPLLNIIFRNGHAYAMETVDDEKNFVRYKVSLTKQ